MIWYVFKIAAIETVPLWARFFVENLSTFRLLWKVSFIAFVVLVVWYLFSIIINRRKYEEQAISLQQQDNSIVPAIETASMPDDDPWKSLLQENTLEQSQKTPVQMAKPGFFASNTPKSGNMNFMPELRVAKNEEMLLTQDVPVSPHTFQTQVEKTDIPSETDDPWKKLMQDSAKQTPSANKSREIPLSLELEQLTQSPNPQEEKQKQPQSPALEIIKNPQRDRSSL